MPKLDSCSSISEKYVLFPIKNKIAWDFYKLAETSFWTAEEIDLIEDKKEFDKLKKEEQYFIKNVLSFFAGFDGLVNDNLNINFIDYFDDPAIKSFYGFQYMIENIHGETYSLLIDTYITDKTEKEDLFKGLENNPAIKAKCDWATKYMNSKCDIATKIFAFALVEGLLFQSSFCAIFYMKKRGLLPGLSFANQLISRDEGLHFKFAAYIYNEYCDKLSIEKEDEIIKEAVKLSKDFATESLPVDLIGMNSNTMKQYIEFVADYLLYDLSKRKLYNQKNPYDWMDLISLQGKTNFFDLRVAEYQKSKVGNTAKENTEFKIDFNMI